MLLTRSSGILLHPTSFPGPYGIGDLGQEAYRWIDFLAQSRCGLWQLLPLGPTGFGDSPYQCFSAFAGNPYLVSPDQLLIEGLIQEKDIESSEVFPAGVVDFGKVIPWKLQLLDRAYEGFRKLPDEEISQEFEAFRQKNALWLDDYTLFMALKDAHKGKAWTKWDTGLRSRNRELLAEGRSKLALPIERHAFRQFLFFRQWNALYQYAHQHGVEIIGDAPIFIAHDSADVWAHQELYYLDLRGKPKVVAGVPPDYFSPTGQLWGNPLYYWEIHQASGYQWWIDRIRAVLSLVDYLRLDHFRGFCGYWEVPGNARTAEKGRWVFAPGMDFFEKLQASLGDLPIIAEDLGVITADVIALREKFNLPGMKILQFAFGGTPKDAFLPHNYPVNCAAYTGTHDNDTVLGWYQRVPEEEKSFYRRYMARDGSGVSWDLIRAIWSSVAVFALAPLQDFLGLDNQARMNYPGKPAGNWGWRVLENSLTDELAGRIQEINYLYDRQLDLKQEALIPQVEVKPENLIL